MTIGDPPTRKDLGEAVVRLEEAVALLDEPDLPSVAKVVVNEARRLMPSVECVMSVVFPWDHNHFTALAGAGTWAEGLQGGRWPLAGTLSGAALLSHQIVETADAPTDSSQPDVFAPGSIRVGRVVPVLGGDRLPDRAIPLGVLGFWRSEMAFTTDERVLIDAFARHASLHLVAAEAEQVTRRAQRRLEISQRVALELQASLAPRDVIGRLLTIAAEVARADRATLSSMTDEVITVEATSGGGSATTWIGKSYGMEFLDMYPELQLAIDSGKPIAGGRLNVEKAAPEFREAMSLVQQTLTLPLISGEAPVGFLLLSRFDDEPFDRDEMDLMAIIASVAALTLRNAWVYSRVEQTHHMKSDFLNAAAHELRTPITVVQGYVDIMLSGQLGEPPPKWHKPLNLLEVSGKRLSQLIDSILDAARLDAGTITVPLHTVDVREVVSLALQRAEPRITLTGATVTTELPLTPVLATTNPDYVGRALDNLIDNALTYHAGSPSIEVILTSQPVPELLIRDHGLGIPAQDRERIFERFVRISDQPWSQFRGTGLGLHLCRQFAEAAGAQLRLRESDVGKGSTFAVTLQPEGESS